MLAQNFKTAANLKITDAEHRSLVLVMGMFERGEIPAEKFHMRSVEDWCGSQACIMGWCLRVAGNDVFNGFVDDNGPLYRGLFLFGDSRRFRPAAPEQAAIAIRSFLTTGKAQWDLAIA